MTRRLLTVVGGGGTITQGPLGRIPGTYGTDDLLPGGAKIRGLQVTPSDAQWTNPGNVEGWGWEVMWRWWDPDWIEAQLDDAVEFGCNAVRIMGSVRGVAFGYYTRATYLSRWSDVLEMCRTRGLYVYPVGNPGGYELDFFSQATLQSEMVAWAEHITAYRTTLAIDLVQEDTAYGSSADGIALKAAVAAVTTVPLTFSITGGTPSTLGHADNATAVTSLTGIVDYFDLHWYVDPGEDDIEQYWWDGGRTSKLLIGEYGQNFAAGSASQTARYEAVSATINHTGNSGRRPAGAFAYCARDFGPNATTEMWGLSTASGARRDWIITPFETIPVV